MGPPYSGPPTFTLQEAPEHVQICSTWTSPNRDHQVRVFQFVYYVAQTVKKRAVGIRLKCLLVYVLFRIVLP